MAPAPLVPVREDPSYTAALDVTAKYTSDVQAAQADFNTTDIAKATTVVRLWKAAVEQLVGLRQDLHGRRRARIEWIETQLPVGPGIDANTSAADRVVLLAAFHSAYDRAQQSTKVERETMLINAERFGDDVTRRAVLTAAIDDSQWPLVDGWAAKHATETGALLIEWRDLRELLVGSGGVDGMFEMQAFRLPPRPQEWHTLPAMVNAHNVAAVQTNRSPGRGVNTTAIPLIDLGDLLAPPAGMR